MIETTYSQIMNSVDPLEKLLKLTPTGVGILLLSRAIKAVAAEVENFQNTNNELIERFGEQKADGSYQVTESNMPQFSQEIDDVLATIVQLPIAPLPATALDGITSFSIANMMIIDYLFE